MLQRHVPAVVPAAVPCSRAACLPALRLWEAPVEPLAGRTALLIPAVTRPMLTGFFFWKPGRKQSNLIL